MSKDIPTKHYLREVLLYYYILKKSVAETHCLLIDIYGEQLSMFHSIQLLNNDFSDSPFRREWQRTRRCTKKFEDAELQALGWRPMTAFWRSVKRKTMRVRETHKYYYLFHSRDFAFNAALKRKHGTPPLGCRPMDGRKRKTQNRKQKVTRWRKICATNIPCMQKMLVTSWAELQEPIIIQIYRCIRRNKFSDWSKK